MVRTPSLAQSRSTSTPCSAHSARVQHLTSSSRLPVIASIRMQYRVSGVPAGATAVRAGSGYDADPGDAAAIMPRAKAIGLYAMSFLLDGNAGLSSLAQV